MLKISSPAWSRLSTAPYPTIVGNTLLILGLWLGLIHFPSAPSAGLDPSWRMAIGYAAEHQWQFGTEIVFTYGPLGYLLASTNSGGLHLQHLVWQLGGNFFFALSIWYLGRGYMGWRKAVYYVYFFAFGIIYVDAVHMIAIALFSLGLLRDDIVARRWLSTVLLLFISILSLVKFTNLMLALVGIGAVLGYFGVRRRWMDFAFVGGTFAVTFIGGWVILGQSIANLPAYFINSLSVSSGYVEAMGLDESWATFIVGAVGGLAMAAYIVLTVCRANDVPRSAAIAVLSLATLFLNWKHGYVRADGHVMAHYIITLLFAGTFPVLLQDNGRYRIAKVSFLLLGTVCTVIGLCLNAPATLLYAPSYLNSRIIDTANNLLQLPRLPSVAQEQFVAAQKLFPLPSSKALIGNASVDVFGNEQAYAIINGFNLRSRPALQAYAAYNERLSELNKRFMSSERAPEFVLQKVNGSTIDNRLQSMDDSLATRYLYYHYNFVMEDREFMVWKRKAPDSSLDAQTPLASFTSTFDTSFKVPDREDKPVWCEIEIEPSLLGRLRTFFYKPPVLRLLVTDGGGDITAFRMVRNQAKVGFLAYPHFTSNFNVVKFQEGGRGPRIAEMFVKLDRRFRKYFKPEIRVRFFELPTIPRSLSKTGVQPPEVRFRLFNRIPTHVTGPYPPEVMLDNGKDVMLAHPPCTLEFTVPATVHNLNGKFGYITRAYQEGNTTDGGEFIIEWINGSDEKSTLFRRFLRPRDVPEDRGEQTFDIKLPLGPGRLLMRTTPGPADNMAFDWTYWSDVRFTE